MVRYRGQGRPIEEKLEFLEIPEIDNDGDLTDYIYLYLANGVELAVTEAEYGAMFGETWQKTVEGRVPVEDAA